MINNIKAGAGQNININNNNANTNSNLNTNTNINPKVYVIPRTRLQYNFGIYCLVLFLNNIIFIFSFF